MPKKIFTCENCNKNFEAYDYPYASNRYCSKQCHYDHKQKTGERREGVDCVCPVCDKQFYIPQYRFYADRPNYCSLECYGKSLEKTETRICEWCKQEFECKAHLDNKFCCIQCHNAQLAASRDKKVNRVCEHCDKTYKVKQSDTTRFCSVDCYVRHSGYTSLEYACYTLMTECGINYLKQHRINRWIPDAYIPQWRMCICFDGDYWHSKPDRIEADKRFNAYCAAHDFKLVRILESEFQANPLLLIRRIEKQAGCLILGDVPLQMPLFQDLIRYEAEQD